MRVEILGVKKVTLKNGKVGINYMGTKEFTDYDQQNGECQGVDVVREFSYMDYNLCPGDIVNFDYEPGFEGRATLRDVTMIEMAKARNNVPFEEKDKKK